MANKCGSISGELIKEIQARYKLIQEYQQGQRKVTSAQNRKRKRNPYSRSKKSKSSRNLFRGLVTKHHPWIKRIEKLRQVGYTHDIYSGPSEIHNRGVFTKSGIKSGTIIVEYVGEIIDKEEQERRDRMGNGDYFAEFTEGKVIDAFWTGNISKFINHSCEPNCALELVESADGLAALVISAKRNIRPMEELSFDYKYEDSNSANKPLVCNCGFKLCRGYVNATQFA